jgi:hypothetical protein
MIHSSYRYEYKVIRCAVNLKNSMLYFIKAHYLLRTKYGSCMESKSRDGDPQSL